MIHDVVVLGATVAGLTAARTLAREGFNVVVLDPNMEHRSAAIGHGVAAAGHASTVADMRSEYGDDVTIEHIVRNVHGTGFIRQVIAEAGVEGRALGFVDRSLGDAAFMELQQLAQLFVRAGAEVRLVCTGCGREQVMTRRQLEQATRAVIPGDGDEA